MNGTGENEFRGDSWRTLNRENGIGQLAYTLHVDLWYKHMIHPGHSWLVELAVTLIARTHRWKVRSQH